MPEEISREESFETLKHFLALLPEKYPVEIVIKLELDIQRQEGLNEILRLACELGDKFLTELAIKAGAEVNDKSKYGHQGTAAHKAVDSGSVECLMVMIEHGCDVNATDHFGMTPAHWAAYDGQTGCLALLLKNGADLDVRNKNGLTLRELAVNENELEVVDFIDEWIASHPEMSSKGLSL